jgi:hypothetical protein
MSKNYQIINIHSDLKLKTDITKMLKLIVRFKLIVRDENDFNLE